MKIISYNNKENALNGVDSSEAIQEMVDELGYCKLPNGWIKHEGTIILYKEGNAVYGENNKTCNLVTTKPNKMFRPIHNKQEIKGFTSHFTGEKGGSVIYVGGEHKGGIDLNRNGKEYNHWYNRTRLVGNVWNFDVEGYYNVTPIDLDFNNEAKGQWGYYSRLHFTKIRGHYKGVDTGLLIKKKANSNQSINTLDIDVNIWGANKFIDIDGINFSKIRFMGQEKVSPKMDLGNFKNSGRIMYDGFIYDVGGKRSIQFENIKDLELMGWAKIHSIIGNDKKTYLANHKFYDNCNFK